MGQPSVSDRALLICVFYCGPWQKAAEWLWGITPDGGARREVPDGCLRDRLACWCDYRDKIWVYKHAVRNRKPRARWKRPAHGPGSLQERDL